MSNLLTLDAATDARVCGHKAATLAALRNLGFEIPDGFVIPVGVSAARDEVAAALARLGDGPVAVRSSGLAEDLPDASFAGQYETLLNVRGVDAVLDAAATCVASATDGRVAMYGQAVRPMAVLVQRMVDADVAGVAFSANPLTANRDEVRVSATRGLGDTLVSGGTDADEWLVTADRATAVAQPQKALGPEVARRVATLARKAEAARLAPQDVEWAMAGDRLWLLQSRPITALPVAPDIEVPKGSWQKDAAHFAEPLSPFAARFRSKRRAHKLPRCRHVADRGGFGIAKGRVRVPQGARLPAHNLQPKRALDTSRRRSYRIRRTARRHIIRAGPSVRRGSCRSCQPPDRNAFSH